MVNSKEMPHPAPVERKPGFYWVKENEGWAAWKWTPKGWTNDYITAYFNDDDIGEIGPYIPNPDEIATRPAPAATDTGLVTMGYAHRGTIGLLLEGAVSKAVIVPKAGGDFNTPVMLVEQAVELLAAERAWAKDRGVLAVKLALENSGLKGKIDTLEVDNAAQAARIKELETERTMIVSHATMGGTNGIGLSVNEISVCITALRNKLYTEGKKQSEAKLAAATDLLRRSRQSLKRAPYDLFVNIDTFLGDHIDGTSLEVKS